MSALQSERKWPLQAERKWPLLATLAVAFVLLFWLGFSLLQRQGHSAVEIANNTVTPYTLAGKQLYAINVQAPPSPPRALVQIDSRGGERITAACTTCHATRQPDPTHSMDKLPDEFHQGLVFRHGGGALSCLSCHNPENYDELRSANGASIVYADVMLLCAQCHSSQYEDYIHGAHGGMTGFWDLSRGPRTRHSCVQCHDPHAPAFPSMQPTFKPIDRGLNDMPSVPDVLHRK